MRGQNTFKYSSATQNGLSIVTQEWLWVSYMKGRVQHSREYTHNGVSVDVLLQRLRYSSHILVHALVCNEKRMAVARRLLDENKRLKEEYDDLVEEYAEYRSPALFDCKKKRKRF